MDELILRLDISGNIAKASACCGGQIKSVFQELPKREWVGLTDEEEIELDEKYGDDFNAYIDARDAKLKEKNHD